MQMRRWDGFLESYMRECEARDLSSETVVSRRREIERWGCWLKRRKPKVNLEEVGSELVIDYLKSRTQFVSKPTVCSVLSHLRGMSNHLMEVGVWRSNPLRWIRGPKLDWRQRLPKRVGAAHLGELYAEAARSRQEYGRYLWTTILSIFYGIGVRRGELSRLDVSHWDGDRLTMEIDGRKTGLVHRVPVSESVAACVEAYLPRRANLLAKQGRLDEVALFVNGAGVRLTGSAIGGGIHRLARRASVPLVSVHQFRHSCASDLMGAGIPLSDIQQILGHATIQSTMRYTEIAGPQRREAMVCHPINEMLGPKAGEEKSDA
jgi:site-specific recombinase XerD